MPRRPNAQHDRLARAASQAWSEPDVTDLGLGHPDPSLLPVELLERAFSGGALRGRYPLQYGSELGDGFFRLALGAFLSQAYGAETDPEAIMVTNGNSQAIDLVCRTLAGPGDVVVVEEPTYFLAIDIFRQAGLRVVSVPVDADGLSIDALESVIRSERPRLVYTIPAFQNPSGATMSAARRARLVRLATEHGFLVVADEVYQLLDFGTSPPSAMATHVGSGAVVSLGSFSKILAPGLRLGWAQAALPLLERMAKAPFIQSGGGLNPFASAAVRVVLEDGWQTEHLERQRSVLAQRRDAMAAALQVHLDGHVEFTVPDGGYFYWLRFNDGVDVRAWEAEAVRRRIGFRAGSLFSTSGGLADRMRLGFSYYDEATLAAAVAVLGEIVRGD